ncbi:ABC transporter permease [uncultured Desulfovibrio sp.]|uniref:ABC transporter permease n=1 Tax=uncultured Desulfovibrio sp. TaxID=167968 RepID=UPI002089C585|nr:ABC transporter permease [uncultured Desulfovibrio sp.]GKG93928.1 taurine ABC transporter permease [Desulfovibrionaceae bacterium]GKI12478.1 taurine ABC transporter permease [Desulfovibrionaceae bacterium]
MRQDTEKKDAADQELNLEIQKANYFATAAKENWISIVSFLIFLVIWELICRFDLIGPYQLVPPSEVITVFFEKLTDVNPDGTVLQQHAVASLALALAGFLAAVVIGVPLGLFMGWYPKVNLLVRPLFDAIRPIPPIAWIPIAILWLGIGMTAKAFIIFLAAFVPCVINSYTGIRLTNPVLIRVAEIYGASNFETFRKIGVPSAIPMIFTGMKLSLNAAWTTLVAAELLAASVGLGFMIQQGRRLARPDIIIVGMLTIGFLGALMSWILTRIEARFASSRRLA